MYNSSRMTGAETDILLLTEGTSTTHGVTIKEKLYKNFLVAHVSVNRSYRMLPFYDVIIAVDFAK